MLSCLKVYPPSKAQGAPFKKDQEHSSTQIPIDIIFCYARISTKTTQKTEKKKKKKKKKKTAGAVISPDVMAHRRQNNDWSGIGLFGGMLLHFQLAECRSSSTMAMGALLFSRFRAPDPRFWTMTAFAAHSPMPAFISDSEFAF